MPTTKKIRAELDKLELELVKSQLEEREDPRTKEVVEFARSWNHNFIKKYFSKKSIKEANKIYG
jgi:hypothetical protein